MLKVSHAKPLHDATAQMTDEAVTHRPQTTTIAMDAKPTKHTQTLTLRKASGIVQMQNHISTQTIAVRKVIEIVRKISLMVRMGSNPHRHGSE